MKDSDRSKKVSRRASPKNSEARQPDLANNLAFIQMVLDGCEAAIFVTEANLDIVFVNKPALTLSGYSRDELIGKHLSAVLPIDAEYPERLASSRSSINTHSKLQRKEEAPLDAEVSIKALDIADSFYLCVSARETGKTDNAGPLTEQPYRELVENISDVIYALNPEGVVTYISPAVERVSGYAPEEVIGGEFIEFIHPDDRELWTRNFEERLKGSTTPLEYRVWTKDRSVRWLRSSSQVIHRKGKVAGIQGVLVDITEQRKAESVLREREERYRTLFEDTRDMIYISTVDGDVIDVNQAASEVLGYSKHELLQMNVKDLYVDLEQRKRFQDEIEHSGSVKDFEVNLFAREGEVKTCLITATAKRDHDGNILGYHGIIRDVTRERRLQGELQRAYRLESAGKLAGQIAHDFNNLLSPLAAYPALIRDQLADDHPGRDLLDEMEFTANKIAEINQQLLTLGRRGHYNLEPIDLNGLVHNVIVTQQLPDTVAIREELGSDLFMIKGGEAQLTRALINLLNNAIEAMEGEGTLVVKTENLYLDTPLIGYTTVNQGEYVRLSVSDTGGGIPPEIVGKVFDPFFTTKTMERQRGSGLGLSVVHSIVEDNNGYITVDSSEGGGAVFALYFPVAREFSERQGRGLSEIKGGVEAVLIVDDDPMQRKVMRQLLQRCGYQVEEVASGEKAVEHVRNSPTDLLLLDMVMEGIDGAEAYRQILEIQPDQKAIILSGYAMSERVRQALSLGAATFISKPIIPNTLIRTVRSVLDSKS